MEVTKLANISGLSINIEVLEQMAAMAALETNGVAAMHPRRIDVVSAISRKSVLKPVHAEVKNGAVTINLYIKIVKTGNAKTIAEAVQADVKEKVQNMTGNAVTKVNVFVMDAVDGEEN